MKQKHLLPSLAVFLLFCASATAQQFSVEFQQTSMTLMASNKQPGFHNHNPLLMQPFTVPHKAVAKTEEHWRRLRSSGIVLTSLGAACITAGALLIQADVDGAYDDGDGTRAAFGILGIAGGITSVGGGITMWAIGNNRLKKMQSLSIKTTGSTTGLVYNF